MACRHFGVKILPKPMLVYCEMNLKEQQSVILEWNPNTIIFIQENAVENVCKILDILLGSHCVKVVPPHLLYIMYICLAIHDTVKCWYNAVQFITILPSALQ